MSKQGRWADVAPAQLFVGAEGGTVPPPKKNTWKTIALVVGIGAAAYFLWPEATRELHDHEAPPQP